MKTPYPVLLACAAMIVLALSCQKEISSEQSQDPDPDPPTGKKCRVTEASNLQWSEMEEDSTSFTRFFYDSIGRVKNIIVFTGDTDRYYYSPTQIIIEEPRTYDRGGGPQTDLWTLTYALDPRGLAKYSTNNYNGYFNTDSTVYTYDANGYLVRQDVYDLFTGDDYVVNYSYKDGNMVKAVFQPTYNYHPDSIVFKYTDTDATTDVYHYMTSDKYRDNSFYPWTGKQSKKLISQSMYYWPWETTTSRLEYSMGSDGVPVTIRTKATSSARPGVEKTDAIFVKYKCD
ncbi:MAG: hypothetical protein WCF67_20600 [Chitinophagaceae bacterium]